MNFYNGKSEQPFLTHTCCQSHFLGKTLAKEDESERLSVSSKGQMHFSQKSTEVLK